MVDRIKEIMEYLGQSSSQFADGIDVPRAVLSHIMSGRNKPSLDVIIRLLAKHKNINPAWLLYGEGEMLTPLAPLGAPRAAKAEPEIEKSTSEVASPRKAPDTDKVQNNVLPDVTLPLPVAGNKKVKQVIIIYTDNTFSALTPEP